MNIIDIISKKQKGNPLSKEEIDYVIDSLDNEAVSDAQISALLMAICINGMNEEETFMLVDKMLKSGETVDLSFIENIKVDKHSTGGVGDKTTMILLPLVASCGVVTPKMAGKGLGFTGGTIDKLDSIPGMKSSLSLEEYVDQIKDINIAISGQTADLVPADKKLYALRDVTGTVESIPLIASSIMSKKIASGSDKFVIDLKVGKGALMKNIEDARLLADTMIKIGKRYDKQVICVLTDMNQPLGNAIGNSLEVLESIEVLKGGGPTDIKNLVVVLGTFMVAFGLNTSISEANNLVLENLKNGKAYEKFLELIERQGGDIENILVSEKIVSVKSKENGFIRSIETDKLGELVRRLGGGRYNKDDNIDHSVGVVLNCKCGDYITEDEEILKVYMGDKNIKVEEFLDCFDISMSSGTLYPLVYEIRD